MIFSDREIATLIAALRLWQNQFSVQKCAITVIDLDEQIEWSNDISTDGGRFTQLSTSEIDEMVERLNLSTDQDDALVALNILHDAVKFFCSLRGTMPYLESAVAVASTFLSSNDQVRPSVFAEELAFKRKEWEKTHATAKDSSDQTCGEDEDV